ncbi:MAG: MFS transporter [Rhizobiaceae bacterium]|nr:MFS transporter [Rhizobiaceae bacterium]
MSKTSAENLKISQNWTIVVFGFLALAISFSARSSLGLVMPVWQEEFGWSASFISSVGAAGLIVMAMIAPFSGRIADVKGPRFTLNLGLGLLGIGCGIVALMNSKLMFIIGFSFFCATGFGIVAVHVVATAVSRSFSSGNTGLASGIALSGSSGGQFVIIPLIAALLAFVSWRWSFGALSLASFALVPCILNALSGPHTTKVGQSSGSSEQAEKSDQPRSSMAEDFLYLVKQPVFHALFWSFFICGITTTGVIETHLLPFANFCGLPPLPSATAYGLLSAVNLGGMILAGWLSDRVNRVLLLASIYILRGFTFIVLASLPGQTIETLYIFAILFGVVDYSTVPVTASLVKSYLGLRTMGLAMGMISAGHALGAAAGAFAGGYLFDLLGNYNLLWTVSLWAAIGAGAIVLLIPLKPKRDPDAPLGSVPAE